MRVIHYEMRDAATVTEDELHPDDGFLTRIGKRRALVLDDTYRTPWHWWFSRRVMRRIGRRRAKLVRAWFPPATALSTLDGDAKGGE